MVRHPRQRPSHVPTIASPQPQTLTTAHEMPRRRTGFPPRYTLALGASIGDDLTVIGHLSVGRLAELYQVWSAAYLCALTCKIILPQFAPTSKEARALKREATLLRRLAHPHIVQVFGQGIHDGRVFLLQEYLHGPSLLALIEAAPQRQVPTPDALKAIVHLCAALAHLHDRGYVHQDIKPANVLLRGGIPILIDFDVAYRIQPGQTPHEPCGTDPYMAPEQCLHEALSPATDLYSVGAVLYEMLTGRWLFEDTLLNTPEHHTLEERYPQIGRRRPPPPRQFNPQIPPALEAVLMQCLRRHPGQRFLSARALAKSLVRFLTGPEQLWPESVDVQRTMG